MNLEVNEFGQFYFKEVFEYSEELSKIDYLELHQQLWNQMVKTLIEKNIYYEDEDILKEQALTDTEVNLKFRKILRIIVGVANLLIIFIIVVVKIVW